MPYDISGISIHDCDDWSYRIRRAKFQSNLHHQQTNMQHFTGRMSDQQCESTVCDVYIQVCVEQA